MTFAPRITEEVERLLEEDVFEVWSPGLSVLQKSGEDVEQSRPIGGYCSTEDLDRQDEVVLAKGLDFREFVKYGYFNDNHKQDTAAVLGYPRKAELRGKRWWTEGNLLRNYGPADRIWELAKALAASNAPRNLGFSIEGKVMLRDSRNRILRAKVRNVAVTAVPVNTSCTWSILAKSFASPAAVSIESAKALSAGHGLRHSDGAALRTEDLESEDEESSSLDKSLSLDQAVDWFRQKRPQYSEDVCIRLALLAYRRGV